MYGYNDIRERMELAIPPWWQGLLEAREFQRVTAEELARLWTEFYTFQDGRYATLATTQLRKWEMLLGLNVSESNSVTWGSSETRLIGYMEGKTWGELEYDYETRRSAVLSRLRGFGPMTRSRIINMAKAYTGGSVKITEYPGEYRVEIEFTDVIGIPLGIDNLKQILREAMPAHIQLDFKYKYITWNQFDAKGWTFNDLDAQDLTWDEFDSLEP